MNLLTLKHTNMKKILFFYAIYLGVALQPIQVQACCLDNETPPANKTTAILQSPKVDNAKVIQFIKDFYANYVFGAKNYVPAVKKHCTAKLQKQLKDNYEYDGEGYAIWNFRTGMQDGPSDISKVTSVAALGNGLYKVNFIDMGIKGNRTLKIIDVNGTLKFDAIK